MPRRGVHSPRLASLCPVFRPGRRAGLASVVLALALTLASVALSGQPQTAAPATGQLTLVHPGDAPPYLFLDAQGRPAGLLVQYWRLWSEKSGVPVQFLVAGGHEAALAMLDSGQADAHAGLTATPELEARLNFSRPLLDLGVGIFAAASEQRDLATLERAAESVGLVAGDPSAAFLAATLPGLRQSEFTDLPALAAALSQGQVRAAAGPALLLRHQLQAALGADSFRLLRSFPGMQLRSAVPQGRDDLLERINAAAQGMGQAEVRALEAGWTRKPEGTPPWAWPAAVCALLLVAAAASLVAARRQRRLADARIREAELLQQGLLAEMARHRKTQDLLSSAIEQSPSGILIAYADPAIPAVYNRQALRLLGLPGPLSQLPKPAPAPFLLYTPAGALMAMEELPLSRALRHGESVEGAEFRLVLSDGTERWISANAAPVREPGGDISAAVVVFHDISASRESDRELARFKFFLDSGVEEVYLVRPDSTVAYVNEAVARSLGRPREELLEEPLMVIDPAYGPENYRKLLQRVREGQQTFETVQSAASGARLVKEIKAFYMRFGDEEFVCAFGRDITSRKNLLHELESTRALFAAALEQSLTGIAIADAASGRITIANSAAAAMLDTTPEKLKEMSTGQFLPGWEFRRADGSPVLPEQGPVLYAVRGEATRDLEVRYARTQGPDRWLLANAGPIRSEDGTIVAGILTLTDITGRKQMEQQLLFKALHDGLTGLPNRALCLERIQQVALDAQRRGSLFAVAFIDLDRFKMLNDSLGHSFGDRVLIEASKRLVRALRGQDTVCRFGGDEFVLIVDGPASTEAAQDIIRGALERLREPLVVDGQEVRLTASVGVVVGPNADSPSAESVLQNADVAMHRAKDAGRDRVRMFHPGMLRRAVELMALDADMRRALEQDEFLVYFQPIFSMTGAEVRGLEALVRWKSPLRGLVGPDLFIPHAEESGLIVPLGERVLRRACATMALWRLNYPESRRITLSVNLSARQFAQPDIVETVRQALAESGLPPALLKIEITESALMDDPESALTSMRRLKALGVSLAIDDFGTGYSSLAYLQRFPVDILKIDRGFVRDLPREDSDSRELVRAIVALGHSLRLSVVAEGVESREQLEILAALGCESAQGFLFSPPVPEVGVEPFLGRRTAQIRPE